MAAALLLPSVSLPAAAASGDIDPVVLLPPDSNGEDYGSELPERTPTEEDEPEPGEPASAPPVAPVSSTPEPAPRPEPVPVAPAPEAVVAPEAAPAVSEPAAAEAVAPAAEPTPAAPEVAAAPAPAVSEPVAPAPPALVPEAPAPPLTVPPVPAPAPVVVQTPDAQPSDGGKPGRKIPAPKTKPTPRVQTTPTPMPTVKKSLDPTPAPALAPALDSPAAAPTVVPASTTRSDASRGQGQDAGRHTVRAGESLWSIAGDLAGANASPERVASVVVALWRANSKRIATGSPDVLPVGVVLRVPKARA